MRPLSKISKKRTMKNSFLLLVLYIFSYPLHGIAQVMPQGFLIGPDGMIGSQLWASRNLAVTSFNNGNTIPNITSAANWGASTPQMCSYNFNAANDAIYGKLYNWYAIVDTRGICPVNWHIPTDTELTTLNSTIGSNGGDLKEAGLVTWNSPNTGATDKYNFKALATGYMGTTSPSGAGNVTYFWSNTASSSTFAYTWSLSKDNALLTRSTQGKIGGFSVRCIHD